MLRFHESLKFGLVFNGFYLNDAVCIFVFSKYLQGRVALKGLKLSVRTTRNRESSKAIQM